MFYKNNNIKKWMARKFVKFKLAKKKKRHKIIMKVLWYKYTTVIIHW